MAIQAGVLCVTTSEQDLEAVHEPTHNLPSPEEYRSSMVVGDGSQGAQQGENNPTDHDQLPTVEEYKVSAGSGSVRRWGYRCYAAVFCVLILLTVLIVVVVFLTQETSLERSSSEKDRPSSSNRRSGIIDHLINAGISTESLITTSGTPQNKALEWLVTDEFNIPIPDIPKQYSRLVERYVLAVLYFSTNEQDTWSFELMFLAPVDHCNWHSNFPIGDGTIRTYGITSCSTVAEDSQTEGGMMVTGVSLRSNKLSGSFPNEIQFLHRLESLSIAFNPSLRGHLDSGLHNLYRLKEFQAHYCALSGTVPSEIGNLQQLTSLVLANNKLEGSLPDSFFTLENLEVLALDDNMLHGDIGQFSVFAKLKAAYLEDNFFVGSMSERLVTAWSSEMVQLDLSRNSINSTIPTGIFAMSNLQMLDLHGNRLHGSIPDIARQGTAPLEVLALHDNDLTGVIPEAVMSLAPTLTHLDLSKNSLATPLPSAIGQLTKLVSLYLGENNFSAQEFPPFLFSLTSLQELSMKGSEMTGTIPSEIRALSLLRLLDLDMNRFVGTIPHDIGFLDELKFLLSNRNSLSGVLPSTFSRLHSLSILLIDHNKINGTANVICQNDQLKVDIFVADCQGPEMEVRCSCCSLCCNALNVTCNQLSWNSSLDPIWEYGYTRTKYEFGSEAITAETP